MRANLTSDWGFAPGALSGVSLAERTGSLKIPVPCPMYAWYKRLIMKIRTCVNNPLSSPIPLSTAIKRASPARPGLARLRHAKAGFCVSVPLVLQLLMLPVHADDTTSVVESAGSAIVAGNGNEPQRNAIVPASLIDSMSKALNTLNYEGTFVHAQGQNLTSMHILHSTDAYGELERLTALDGEAREVIRNNSLVTCIWPDSQSVVVSKSKPRDLLPQVDASLADNQRYRLSMGADDRVSGRGTYVVNVTPKDGHRYGHRFWIDKDTYMLLRSMLLDGPGKTVEQIIFTSIEYPQRIDPARFAVQENDERISWLEPKKNQASASVYSLPRKQDDKVGFSQLPEGYRKVSETFSPMPIQDGPVSHVMLSDGMASVSVYVEYVKASDQNNPMVGLSQMGAMNAFGVSTSQAVITVVGEVPANTVKAIALAVTIKPQ